MSQPVNGDRASSGTDDGWAARVIAGHLAQFAARMSGPYDVQVITAGQKIPCVRVTSRIDPELHEDVLVDFSTEPPGYLTAFGHRLGDAGDPGAAAAILGRIFTVDEPEQP